jgi:hypothetical protein
MFGHFSHNRLEEKPKCDPRLEKVALNKPSNLFLLETCPCKYEY